MSLETIGGRAARVAHHAAETSDPETALVAVIRRGRRRDRIQRVAAGAVIIALLAGIGVAVLIVRGNKDDAPTLSDLSGTQLRIPIEADLPDGFRLVRNHPWALGLDARCDLTAEQPWAGFSIDRPDGVIDPETQEVLPMPDDSRTGCGRIPQLTSWPSGPSR